MRATGEERKRLTSLERREPCCRWNFLRSTFPCCLEETQTQGTLRREALRKCRACRLRPLQRASTPRRWWRSTLPNTELACSQRAFCEFDFGPTLLRLWSFSHVTNFHSKNTTGIRLRKSLLAVLLHFRNDGKEKIATYDGPTAPGHFQGSRPYTSPTHLLWH